MRGTSFLSASPVMRLSIPDTIPPPFNYSGHNGSDHGKIGAGKNNI